MATQVTVNFDESSGAPSFSFGIGRRTASAEEKRDALDAVIERLNAMREKTGRSVAIVFDEFQAIRALDGESGEWHLRDLIQRHGNLSFICAGSEESLIREMMGPRRAFYKMFDVLHLGPIDERHFASWIDKRLQHAISIDGAVGAEVVLRAGPRTQDIVQVARQLFYRGMGLDRPIRTDDVIDAVDDIVRNEDPLIRTLWNEISAQQQDVLRVLALGADQIFSSEVRDRYGLPAPSSVHKAVDALVTRGLLTREEDAIRFDSPFVQRWVLQVVARDLG